MGAGYRTVLWNRHKRIYDLIMLGFILLYAAVFAIVTLILNPQVTPETLIIRSLGSLAFIMLHIILCIGPLARISPRFLPLLYNRRHLGVTMFFIAFGHGIFSLIQFHALGDQHPLISLFSSNTHYGDIMRFPFQPLGFIALMILLVMAATSHDFWLRNLGRRFWKSMHMLVYVAYSLLILHVLLGVVQLEQSPVWILWPFIGMGVVLGLHVWSAFLPKPEQPAHARDGFHRVGTLEEIPENRAKIVRIGEEEIAVFKYDGKLSAVHNECKHQMGPLGEGKVVDGCITCPWHGYQYRPEDGCSPAPFTEKVRTYDLMLEDDIVYVHPFPYPEGTKRKPVIIPKK